MVFKKAELSMTVIVGAVLALLVLIILAFVVLSKVGDANDGFSSCPGICSTSSACNSPEFPVSVPKNNCQDRFGNEGSQFTHCCVGLG